jgi:hypothetical protein
MAQGDDMSTDWLDIQSFVSDQEALRAINDLSIAVHLSFARVPDEDRVARADTARRYLAHFLTDLQRVLQGRQQEDVASGVDPRMQELAESFESARRDMSRERSVLLKMGPTEALALLDATDPLAKRELLRALDELRELITHHQQSSSMGIFEDF